MDLVDDLKFTKPNSKYPDGKIELFLKKNKQTKKSNDMLDFFCLLMLLTKAQSYRNLFDNIASFLLNNLVNFTSRKQTNSR